LLWEGDGFLLLYKRIEDGSFSWPKTPDEAAELTRNQYDLLMKGLNPLKPKIREISPRRIY
jgi:transposase